MVATDRAERAFAMTSDQAICCFCNRPAPLAEMFCLGLYPPSEEIGERSQMLYCHGECIDRVLHPAIPRHPDLLDD